MKAALRALVLAITVVAVLGIAAYAWLRLAPRHVPAGQAPLVTLEPASLPAFRAAFSASAEEEVRILAMLSPT